MNLTSSLSLPPTRRYYFHDHLPVCPFGCLFLSRILIAIWIQNKNLIFPFIYLLILMDVCTLKMVLLINLYYFIYLFYFLFIYLFFILFYLFYFFFLGGGCKSLLTLHQSYHDR